MPKKTDKQNLAMLEKTILWIIYELKVMNYRSLAKIKIKWMEVQAGEKKMLIYNYYCPNHRDMSLYTMDIQEIAELQ